MTEFTKHPNYDDQLLSPREDIFRPEFKRDSRGRYFMQLPGYGKWMVGNEPGSKVISQGTEDEAGGPWTNPDSIKTGSLSAETVISVGQNIFLDGTNGCIHVGDYLKRTGASISICGNGWWGYSGNNVVFGYFLEQDGDFGPGDVFFGDYASDEYVWWDDSDGKLYIKGDLVIQGDLQSANYVAGVSGWKLTYLTGEAEFQDVIVRGQITMEAGSSGSADYISESTLRKWAAESGADITGNHTSDNTNNVSFSTALDAATGADRGLNAINALYRYSSWLLATDLSTAPGGSIPATGVYMDATGIYGVKAGVNQFFLDATTGDALFRGTIYASAGLISGWAIDTDRIWKERGAYTKLELNTRENAGEGIFMHIQAFTDSNSNYSSPTGVQITPGNSASPDPRLDIYNNGTRRVTLNQNGLYFYTSGGSLASQIAYGTGDGDVTFGGGVVRCFSNGVRVSTGRAFAAQASGSTYLQMYGSGGEGIMEIPSNSYGFKIMDANSSYNLCRWTTNYMTVGSNSAYIDLVPATNGNHYLGTSSLHWYNLYVRNLSSNTNLKMYFGNSFQLIDNGTTAWTFYRNGSDAYAGSSLSNMKLRASNNITLDTNGTIWLVCSTLSKPAGSFTIDHPLKPDTHFLQHSFVESPEMMNIYRGRGTLVSGRCTVTMPDWFVPLNGGDQSEYSYHLTSIGGSNNLWVEEEMNEDGEVTFAGDSDMDFYYLITAVRHDPFAEQNRIIVEPTKESLGRSGTYIMPSYYSDIRSFTSEARLVGERSAAPEIK